MLRFHAEQQREQESRGDNAAGEGSASDGRINNRRAGKPDSGMFLDNYGRKFLLMRLFLFVCGPYKWCKYLQSRSSNSSTRVLALVSRERLKWVTKLCSGTVQQQ